MANILYVDDDPELGLTGLAPAIQGRHSLAVIDTSAQGWKKELIDAAKSADIVVSDLRLEDNGDPDSLDPSDGVAMNDTIHALHRRQGHSALFMIYSAALDDEIRERRLPTSPFIQAEAMGATWVGRKPQGRGTDFPRQLALFADAVDAVGELARPDELIAQLAALMQLPDTDWCDDAIDSIRSTASQLVDLADSGNRLAPLRWISASALRFPAVLLSCDEVALRLRVRPDWLTQCFAKAAWHELDEPTKYRGLLAGLDGDRWWRAGVDALVWQWSGGRPNDWRVIKDKLSQLAGEEPPMLTAPDPVLAYDEDGVSTGEVLSVSEAVRILPASWPSAAGRPWTSIARAKQKPRLKAIVVSEDFERLGA